MAVVEVGWTIRAGYIGDVRCTRHFPALTCASAPDELFLPPLLAAAEASGACGPGIAPIWDHAPASHEAERHALHISRIMSELRCDPADPLMLVAPELWHERPAALRALFGALLEAGAAAALYCCRPSVAWTLAAGRASALVLDAGHTHTTAAAVLDGFALRRSVAANSAGGSCATARLRGALREELEALPAVRRLRNASARELAVADAADAVKRVACLVRTGAERLEPVVLRAADGAAVTVPPDARTEPFEALFAPGGRSAADLVVQCRRSLDPEWQTQAVPHLLCGGTAQARGYRERILKEAQRRDSAYFRLAHEEALQVVSAADGAWAGASLAADSSSFAPFWITRRELEEEGDSVLHRKLLC